MAAPIEFEVVTPEKLLFSETVDMVTIPGTEGYFGVLGGHAEMISTVRSGVLRIGEGKNAKHLAISKGFAEVRPDRVTLLVDEAHNVEDIDVAAVKSGKGKDEEALAGTPAEAPEYKEIANKVAFAEAQIAATEGKLF
uniref:ATP synthase epsilon chain n=1 Tax=Magnetococcus massalia (strain MO-1) TaxID=451514 RepID=A0A1S7LP29_MAGMO|nr:ATP synthase epsilon chain [Candidatus Magnetococcus massalia]